MKPLLSTESTLTDRYQTTVPEAVRKALHLHKRDKIRYVVQANGHVLLTRADADLDDPVLEQFLEFLALDMKRNPENITALTAAIIEQAKSLTADITIDLDAPLDDEDE